MALVLGADEDARFLLRTVLEIWHFDVAEIINLDESLDAARNICPDVILFDAPFSPVEGLMTIERLNHLRNFENSPIIMLSGHSRDDVRRAALERGATEFLVKPVDFDLLETLLKSLTGSDRQSNELNIL